MVRAVGKPNSLDRALALIGKKYNLLILDSMLENRGRRRFNQLLRDIPSINPRSLSMRLKELEQNRLISKSLVLGAPVKTEYVLTDKAEELRPVVSKLKSWVQKHP